MRLAIVGSGVSGLVAAHLLHRIHDVTVMEANDYIGGHVNTVDVEVGGGTVPVDTGFIVYNRQNYPTLSRLLDELGVETQPSTMSFSVRVPEADLEYNGSTFRQLFAQRRNLFRPRFYRMLADILRFNREAPGGARADPALTLGEYVSGAGYSAPFVDHYLVPMGAAIWSMPRRAVMNMPASFFVQFFENHGMLTVDRRPEWRVVTGGSRRYVDRLVRPFRDRIRLSHPVRHIVRRVDHVLVDGERFDGVILACHSDQALRLLADPTPSERDVLGALPYQANEAVLHTDVRLLPRRRLAWAAWNYHGGGAADAPVAVTYNMNILQTLTVPETLCVTLNDTGGVAPERVIRRIRFEHPVYSRAGAAAQRRHGEISGVGRTHYCGAYWGYGFHEDGAASAVRVSRALGASW